MKKFIVVLFLISIISCKEEEKQPDYLLNENEFTQVLSDFEIAEAIVRLGYNRTKDSLIFNDSIYSSVFRKHNITKALFDSNFTYYSNHTKEFEKIYEEVITNLSTRSAKIQEKVESVPNR